MDKGASPTATGPKASPMTEDKPLCERTIRACIKALPRSAPSSHDTPYDPFSILEGYRQAINTLESLLPKPDPVKALLEEFSADWPGWSGDLERVEKFAHWLINEKGWKAP